MANELFLSYYKDHDDYFTGLQNFVLHLHVHYSMIYRNYGALCNIGCFGQEDFIGYISSNHNGTRCYGELICHHYNIDFFLNNSKRKSTQNGPIDPISEALDGTDYAYNYHAQLCDCTEPNQCLIIYRRCIIREQLYHSLIYKKSSKSVSYFVEYFINADMKERLYGVIQLFFKCNDKTFALIRRHPIKQLYSDYFKPSKYHKLLKKPLDSLFFILNKNPSRFDLTAAENISKHCIVFDKKYYLLATTVSSYNEHD